MDGALPTLPGLRERGSPFSYACQGCGRCCHHKTIRVGPYEIARLAEVLGTTTTEVIDRYLAEDGATLRTVEEDACVFLDGTRCGVHAGRPLVCRLYPLGWATSSRGGEAFVELEPHPETEGVYGEDGTVGDYLETQETAPYERAAARYTAVLRRIESLAETEGPDPGPPPPLTDVDRAVTEECELRGVEVPETVEERVGLHLEILQRWLDGAESS